MTRVVVDTNILAAGLLTIVRPESIPGEVLRRGLDGKFELIVSDYILEELERALNKPYFRRRLGPADRLALVRLLRERTVVVPLSVDASGLAPHRQDDAILATALSSNADFLVTGDAELQSLGTVGETRILSARTLLDALDAAGSAQPSDD